MLPNPAPTRAIFISYRRDDAGGEAGRLYDDLARAFGDDTVFMDVAGIEPGRDFRKSIDENVAQCGVLLAVIGPHWLTIADSSGARRIDSPNDFVRLEIASALARDIPIIPVLVHNSSMPPADALPGPLQDLAYRNGVELTLPRWNSDVTLLIAALKRFVPVTPAAALTQPVRLPPPIPPPPPRTKANLQGILVPIAAAIIIVALIIVGLTVLLYRMGRKIESATPAPVTQGQSEAVPKPQPQQTAPPPESSPPSSGRSQAQPPTPLQNRAVPAPSPTHPQPADPPAAAPPVQTPTPGLRHLGQQPYHVDLPYNVAGIYADGQTFPPSLGLDSAGHAYPPFLKFMTPGTRQLPLGDGLTFSIHPSGIKNVLRCQFTPLIDLPRQGYATMHILAVSVHGPQLSRPFTVTYEDSQKKEFLQSISDWTASEGPRFSGERLAVVQTYVNTAAGTPQNGRFAVYEYQFALNPDLKLRTLNLPLDDSIIILAVTLVPPR